MAPGHFVYLALFPKLWSQMEHLSHFLLEQLELTAHHVQPGATFACSGCEHV